MSVDLVSSEQRPDSHVETWIVRASGLAGYFFPMFGGRALLGIAAGYAYDQLRLEDNAVMPTVRYHEGRAAVVQRIHLMGRLLALRMRFAFSYAPGIGEAADAFGQHTDALGWEIGTVLEGRVDPGFSYALRFTFRRKRYRPLGIGTEGSTDSGRDDALAAAVAIGWTVP